MNEEIWKPVIGYEGFYEVSSHGRVRSLPKALIRSNGSPFAKKGRLLPGTITETGYIAVALRKQSKQKVHYVHRLVCQAFLPNPTGKPQVNHVDGVRWNNFRENLEWATNGENALHSYRVLRHKRLSFPGESNGNAVLTEEQVRTIRETYQRLHPEFGQTALAAKFNISRRLILNIVRGTAWKHIR